MSLTNDPHNVLQMYRARNKNCQKIAVGENGLWGVAKPAHVTLCFQVLLSKEA